MNIRVEKRDGIDMLIRSDIPNWARPASPEEIWLSNRISELEQKLRSPPFCAIEGHVSVGTGDDRVVCDECGIERPDEKETSWASIEKPTDEKFAGTPGFPPESPEQERSMRRDRYPPRDPGETSPTLFKRTCARCGKIGESEIADGIFYCSHACAD